jgi:hypothetical protein
VQNDPVNFTDPTGLQCFDITRTDIIMETGQIIWQGVVGTVCDRGGFYSGGGGRGRGLFDGNPPPPQDDNSYDNCYDFVDYLVDLASNMDSEPRSRRVSPKESIATRLGSKLMGEAADYKFITYGWEGFKDKLTMGWQGAGVYGHILLQAGAYLYGGISGTAFANGFDLYDKAQTLFNYPHDQNDQRPAEIEGNKAGWNVGRLLSNFIKDGRKDPKRLKQDITQELCKPSGGT